MELRHLRYFVAVAEEGSISRAAERLNIQQPPLGQQIRDLEYELGVSLFDRHPKKILLNAAGAVFLADARDILKRAGQAVENIRRYDKGEAGHLSVGFTSSASLHVLAPKLLQQFRLSYPLVKIAVEESETYELILALQEGRIDAALLHIDANRFPDLASTVLSEEDMIVAVPLGHPLADESLEPITLKMLEGQDVVIYRRPDGPGIFEQILQSLDRAGVTPQIVDEVYRIVAAINLVAGGRGVTIVPASMQVLHPEAIAYRALAPGQLSPLPLCIAYRRDLKLSIVRNFVALTKEIAAVPPHARGRA
ncbi:MULTISPECIES: LysR family transcriptional regulator [Rhizobium]|jgi:DNA-binding transcriptional LysR family regulator|uniref:LysR family transcriptional regulator n=2 Tax=Rhizobium/Agrobacterium group TaxID=227290 RepID=UPI00037B1A7D|nr:LysR family transcriptional regulator [Rhizobium leguminosarum]MBA8830736.1 DNA-binding transcriptional LysR family regulator [Rhizobium leguminosarum]MDH6274714.1 DNA-binding transcriptional LysR family regulator [Rhizobium leguminosarum]MVO91650.1 LysR family transcriptional regulator [Rhizobium leguminosarum bv. phaseoli]TAU16162.1 LysR family transcriptional regulator [Rhizobium leguminosarum]TAU36097.1 LysR family transcriptional regulator [Rhizobium leguminosarum]